MSFIKPIISNNKESCIINNNVNKFFIKNNKNNKNIIPGKKYYIVLDIAGSIISLTNIFYQRSINGCVLYEVDFFANGITIPFEILELSNHVTIFGGIFTGIDKYTEKINFDRTDVFTDIYVQANENHICVQADENYIYTEANEKYIQSIYDNHYVSYSGANKSAEIKIIYHNSEIMNYIRGIYSNTTCKQCYGATIDNVLRCLSGLSGLAYNMFDILSIHTNIQKKYIYIVVPENLYKLKSENDNIRAFDDYQMALNYSKQFDFRFDVQIIETQLNTIEQTNNSYLHNDSNNTMHNDPHNVLYNGSHLNIPYYDSQILKPTPISTEQTIPAWLTSSMNDELVIETDNDLSKSLSNEWFSVNSNATPLQNSLSDEWFSLISNKTTHENINLQFDRLQNIIKNILEKKEILTILNPLFNINNIDPIFKFESLNLNLSSDMSQCLYDRLLKNFSTIFNINNCNEDQIKKIYIILNSMLLLSNNGISYESFSSKIK